jgi:hypothetical protein
VSGSPRDHLGTPGDHLVTTRISPIYTHFHLFPPISTICDLLKMSRITTLAQRLRLPRVAQGGNLPTAIAPSTSCAGWRSSHSRAGAATSGGSAASPYFHLIFHLFKPVYAYFHLILECRATFDFGRSPPCTKASCTCFTLSVGTVRWRYGRTGSVLPLRRFG